MLFSVRSDVRTARKMESIVAQFIYKPKTRVDRYHPMMWTVGCVSDQRDFHLWPAAFTDVRMNTEFCFACSFPSRIIIVEFIENGWINDSSFFI